MPRKSKINDTALGRERARRCFYMRQDGYDFRFIAAVFRCRGPGEARTWVAKGERLAKAEGSMTKAQPGKRDELLHATLDLLGMTLDALKVLEGAQGKVAPQEGTKGTERTEGTGPRIVGSADEVAAEIGRSRGRPQLTLIEMAKRRNNQLRKGE